ncbi:MAG: hypothetical protein ACK5TH_17705 [Prosthecobacter sp.]
MSAILLASSYPPVHVVVLFLLGLVCELAATFLGLLGLVLGLFRTRIAPAHRCSVLALMAAAAGAFLIFVSRWLDHQLQLHNDAVVRMGWFIIPPAVIAFAALTFTRWRRG